MQLLTNVYVGKGGEGAAADAKCGRLRLTSSLCLRAGGRAHRAEADLGVARRSPGGAAQVAKQALATWTAAPLQGMWPGLLWQVLL